jgi:alpha-mannosidase
MRFTRRQALRILGAAVPALASSSSIAQLFSLHAADAASGSANEIPGMEILHGQTMQAAEIGKVPTLYVVAYAHLDTQWRWEFPQTIGDFLAKTMRTNFEYIEKYPHYVFNWTGANRYRLMKEYYPGDYARVTKYVAEGRWFPAGSSIEEGDVNLPSAEGIFRQILYGNNYFRKDFGKASNEFMLPDCFGFPASLPSILSHAGLKGFSTQKLSASWQPAPVVGGPDSPERTPTGIPFNVGLWVGPDGKSVIAALNPGGYTSNVYTDLSQDPEWVNRIELDGKVTGVFADYHYVGTGDTGGATRESTVKLLEAIVTKSETVLPVEPKRGEPATAASEENRQAVRVGEGPVRVIESAANQMFDDITPQMTGRMPQYSGDLELINHSAGSLTSQAYHKRWVLKNELLADAAEKSSIMAEWMGGRSYPLNRLNDAWMLELSGHFHDIAAGTATPRAYQFAWNDDNIAANQFADVLTVASQSVASELDTRAQGTPLVIFNSLNIEREDVVGASVRFLHGTAEGVRVLDAEGKEVFSQIGDGKVLILAKVPTVGYAVFDVVPTKAQKQNAELRVTSSSLENARYRVKLDENGDVSSIYDKHLKKELLAGPVRLAICPDTPSTYPAWNMDFVDQQAAPRAYVGGPAKVRIKEHGPVRVALEVTRQTEGSTFVQTISLSAGDAGDRVEFANTIEWRTLAANLKATFPLTATNKEATYNWEVGTIQRPNAQPRQFEVASHRWVDLTDSGGNYGVMLLTDCKNGSDKPNDNTIRMTLLRSPGIKLGRDGHSQGFTAQAIQDWGHHEVLFGLAGHSGDWRQGGTDWQAYRLNNPMIVFEAEKHNGTLGRGFSLVHVSNSAIRVLALKKAEQGNEVIIRVVELHGKDAHDVEVTFAAPLAEAREVNAQEQPIGSANLVKGILVISFGPYQPRTFAVRLGAPPAQLASMRSQPVELRYDLAVATNDDTVTPGGGFDGKGNAMPAEMLPSSLNYNDITFTLAPAKTGVANAVVARGQAIELPEGNYYDRVYLLAAACDGDQRVSFGIGTSSAELKIQDWSGFIGQWDMRLWKDQPDQSWAISASHLASAAGKERRPPGAPAPRYPEDYLGLAPGYVKPAPIAWYASHQHDADGLNLPYRYSYLFAYSIEIPTGVRRLTLPNNDKLRIFAISVAKEGPKLAPAQPLYDTMGRSEPALH